MKIRRIAILAMITIAATTIASAQSNEPSGTRPTNSSPRPGQSSDQDIAHVLHRRLEQAPSVLSYQIQTSVSNGVVTLTGQVDNLLAKRRAEELAEAIRGVRQVRNQIAVVPQQRQDMAIQNDITHALRLNQTVPGYDIKVKVRNGVAILSGQVHSWQEKHLAERLATGVSGVTNVENELAIAYPEDRTDSEIQKDIQSRLHWDPYLQSDKLSVDVTDGAVSLSGFAQSAAGKRRAFEDAWVVGVRSVSTEEVEIVPDVRTAMQKRPGEAAMGQSAAPDDKAIQAALTQAFQYDSRIAAPPQVSVENGQVTLTGFVETLAAKKAATQIALSLPGVTSVNNLTQIKSDRSYSDNQIQDNITGALRRDPLVDAGEIQVSVAGGVANLSGAVTSAAEKTRALQDTAMVPGVREIEDTLNAPPPTQAARESGILTDSAIEDDLILQLSLDPLVNAQRVNVKVHNGVATLTGRVNSHVAKAAAEQDALDAGAFAISNKLVVDPNS